MAWDPQLAAEATTARAVLDPALATVLVLPVDLPETATVEEAVTAVAVCLLAAPVACTLPAEITAMLEVTPVETPEVILGVTPEGLIGEWAPLRTSSVARTAALTVALRVVVATTKADLPLVAAAVLAHTTIPEGCVKLKNVVFIPVVQYFIQQFTNGLLR